MIVFDVLRSVLTIFFYLLIANMIISWITVFSRDFRPRGAVAIIFEFVLSITEPPIHFLRRFIPPLRLGNFGLDLAFIVLIITVRILIGALPR